MIIATAGHVDHGKTTLLQAITGINADLMFLYFDFCRYKAVTSGYGIWKLFSFFLPICFFFLAALIGQHDLFHHQLHLIIAGLCLFCQFLHLILKTEKQKKIYLPKVHFRF